MANLAIKEAVEGRLKITIHAPLMHWDKARIIREGLKLGVDYGLTHSCYDPGEGGRACGRCDSCQLRIKGFAQAGVADPTRYV
jgi:7-cyano-7-deazaguanine synthase